MREVLNIHIGQAGIQLGSSFWEMLCVEHSVSEDGTLFRKGQFESDKIETFFSSTSSSTFVPRSMFLDLEPTVIDEVKTGCCRLLHHPDRLICGPEDAASNFARGFFTIGKLLLYKINHEVRKMFESADSVQGIVLSRSLGGGTGSGLTSAMFDGLTEYPKTTKIDLPIFPSPTLSTSTVEPYNSILAEHFCLEDIELGLFFENEALFDICTKYLWVNYPTYSTINRLIAQLFACVTANIRFENVLNCDLTVLQTNLVPYPRIHFPLCNFSPILPDTKVQHESLTISDLTRGVFERDNQMMKVDPTFGRYMSCVLFFRGEISPDQVYVSLLDIKRDKRIDFVEWCPTGFKVGINTVPPIQVPNSHMSQVRASVALLSNSSAIGQAWQRLSHKFYILYSKRSFLHWFVSEGMEEGEFNEALFNISTLVKDYEEVSLDSPKTETITEEGKVQTNVSVGTEK